MIHVPGISQQGKRISTLTQNIDIMPTILSFFGLEIPATVKGQSLLGLIHGAKDKLRDYALYGMFGVSVNITDGSFTYLRAPAREDNFPCCAYTAMPTFFRSFHGALTPDRIETGRFLPYTDYPVFRFPTSEAGKPFRFANNFRESLLFHIASDYGQLEPLQDRELESFYEDRLIEAMKREQAPAEQYVRLGLNAAH
jgi:hypothetical protein